MTPPLIIAWQRPSKMTILPLPPPSNGTEGSGAVEAAALNGAGTQDDPYVVSSRDDLINAINQANATAATYIALNASSAQGIDLGGNAVIEITNKNIVLEDNGTPVKIAVSTIPFTTDDKGNNNNQPLFAINDGSTVIIESKTNNSGGTVKYNLSYSGNQTPFARINAGGKLIVNGGSFENNSAETYGAVFQNGWNWASGGYLKVTNGLFTNNKATVIGGGVIFSNTAGTDDSQTIVEGGTFDGNVYEWTSDKGNNEPVETGGGAIHSRMGRLTVTGGVFKNNSYTSVNDQLEKNAGVSKGGGGAIFVCKAAGNSKGTSSVFTLGTDDEEAAVAPKFTGNKSTAPGGAIMVSYDASASFKSGTFEGNYAKDMGGAVYTEERTTSDFGYTTVHNNIAAHFGGGLWLCPSGVSVSSRASNIALFDNVAGRDYTASDGSTKSAFELDKNRNAHRYNADNGVDGGAGDDLAVMYPNKDNVATNSVNITDSWFAGEQGAVSWYWDGQSTVRATGFGQLGAEDGWKPSWPGHGVVFTNREAFSVTNRPRYSQKQDKIDAPRTYQQVRKAADYPDPVWRSKGGLAFKTQVSQGTKDAVNAAAKLTFVGNESGTSGGAIGSNGNLRFTSSGVAAWSKGDANDASKELGGSSWKLTWTAPSATATPYVSKSVDDAIWKGATGDVSALRWHREPAGSTTWVSIVEGNVGASGYVGYDTDATSGVFSIENLAEGTYTMTEESAPDGYATSGATYQFKVDLSTASSAIALPKIEVVNGSGTVSDGNAIGNTPLPSIPDIVLKAKKTLVGGTLSADQFTFQLDEQTKEGDAYKYAQLDTKKNNANGLVTFEALNYTAPGTHVYRITETAKTDEGIVYDGTAYYAKAVIEWGHKNSDGKPSTNDNDKKNLVLKSLTYYNDEACTQEFKGTNGNDYLPEFTNYATTLFSFTKVDGSSGANNAPLEGATFKLYKWAGTAAPGAEALASDNSKDWEAQGDGVTSGDAGVVKFNNLPVGTYQLVETAAPSGYQLPAGQWRIVVEEATGTDGKKTLKIEGPTAIKGANGTMPPAFISPDPAVKGDTLKLPNYKGFTLPVSGSTGIWWSGVAGMAMIAASLAALWWQRRRGGGAA